MPQDCDQVEQLLARAQACVQSDRFDDAIMLVRRAHHLAPLRQDIRSILATLLEASASADEGAALYYSESRDPAPQPSGDLPDFREFPFENSPSSIRASEARFNEPDDDYPEEEPSIPEPPRRHTHEIRFQEEDEIGQQPQPYLRRTSAAAPARLSDPAMEEEIYPEAKGGSFLSRLTASVTDTLLGRASADDEEDDEPPFQAEPAAEPPRPSLRRTPPPPVVSIQPPLAPTRQKPSRRSVFPSVPETTPEATPPSRASRAENRTARETAEQYETVVGDLPKSRWPALAIYAFVAIFTAAASTVSYFRFFHDWTSQPVMLASAPAAPAQTPGSRATDATVPSLSAGETDMVARARKYLDEKRYDDAIVVLTQSGAGGSSKSSMEERQVLALAHDKKASMLLENDRLDEAVEHYRKAVALNPGDGGLHLRLGNALYYCGVLSQDKDSQKHLRDALSELTASLEIDRNNVHAYERLATVYEALRDNEQARTAWGQVLKLAPPGETADLAKGRISQLARNH